MTWTAVDQMMILLPAGCGVAAVGLFHLLFGRAGLGARAATIVGLAGLLTAGVNATSGPEHAALAVGFFLLATALTAAAGSGVVAAAVGRLRLPAVRWAVASLVGAGVAVGAVVQYDRADDAADMDMAALAEDTLSSPLQVVADAGVRTDRGQPVVVKRPGSLTAADQLARGDARMIQTNHREANLIRRQPADEASNCHGWVFTGGRFWVTGDAVPAILADNGYRPVADPRPGDLIVYREADKVTHTGVVRYQTPGQPVLVEGKWGRVGVYLHAVDQSPYSTDFTYYRSPRTGHHLAGLDATAD